MTPLIVAILFIAIGAAVYATVEHKLAEVGRAGLWVGLLLLGLVLTGVGL